MKPLKLTFVALASTLFALAMSSCTQDKSPTDPAVMHSAQEQTSPSPMPGGMSGTAGGMMDQLSAGCPIVVEGADVTVTDTEGGVELTFMTATGDVADLRTRVQHMTQMYEMHHGQASMMWHHMGGEGMAQGGPGMGGEGMDGPMPAASTTMTDTDLGARLELRPTDPSQLDTLREHVRWHQQRMHSGECWMLQEQPVTLQREQE